LHHSYLLWKDWFGTEAMRNIWSEENLVAGWLKVENALVVTLSEFGCIPREAADKICTVSTIEQIRISDILEITSDTRHIIAGFIQYMRNQCGEAGAYYHLGTTTQDILDTGLAVTIKQSLNAIRKDLIQLQDILLALAAAHARTVMPGRSQGQHGIPVTFGFKCAIWASEMQDHLERLLEIRNRVLVVSMGAAMGTQASYTVLLGKEKTEQLAPRMAKRLGLPSTPIDVHLRVDRFAELLNVIALIASSLGRIGLEIRDLQRTEVGEVSEQWPDTVEGSSTMVHKKNPEPAHWLEGLAKIARSNAMAVMDIQIQHERDATRTAPEFACIPESFLTLSSALRIAKDIFGNLQVHTDRMTENLKQTRGLMMSEPVWIRLFQKTGRLRLSQKWVKACAASAVKGETDFKTALLEHAQISASLTLPEIDALLDPSNYIGTVERQISDLSAAIAKRREDWELSDPKQFPQMVRETFKNS